MPLPLPLVLVLVELVWLTGRCGAAKPGASRLARALRTMIRCNI